MIILFILFLIQFSIASSCLAVGVEEQKQFAEDGWTNGSDEMRSKVQDMFSCCGFNSTSALNPNSHPSCEIVNVCMILCIFIHVVKCSALIDISMYLVWCLANLLPCRIFSLLFLWPMFTEATGGDRLYIQINRYHRITFQLYRGE